VPLAFSGDGSLLLMGGVDNNGVEVVDWRTGKVTWRNDAAGPYGPWLAQPGGGDFAIALNAGGATSTVVIAHRDGTTTTLGPRDPVTW
jgi:hypothetical protein